MEGEIWSVAVDEPVLWLGPDLQPGQLPQPVDISNPAPHGGEGRPGWTTARATGLSGGGSGCGGCGGVRAAAAAVVVE